MMEKLKRDLNTYKREINIMKIKKYVASLNFGNTFLILGMVFLILSGCKNGINVKQQNWGEVNNTKVFLYTITNSHGMVMKLTNYGGIITSVIVPDKNGKMDDVVLGFDNLQQYLDPNPCFGATIGRFANRIKDAKFEIDGVTYHLTKNSGENCIHGGDEFDRVVWDSKIVKNKLGCGVCLHYLSKDGSNGFPGNLDVYATYILTENNAIHVCFEATTDKSTYVNMTQHSYFNLSGCKELINDHLIKIDADNYTEIDKDIVPTGIVSTVKGTDWDLTTLTRIGDNLSKLDYNGYHYCYVFNKPPGELKKVIEVIEPKSGRKLEISTTQPGVQFYSGNSIPSNLTGKYGIHYRPHIAFCLETQHLPDSPNHANFPTTLLRPGEKYKETVIYNFGIEN